VDCLRTRKRSTYLRLAQEDRGPPRHSAFANARSLTQLLGLGEDSTSINTEVNLEVTQGAARVARIKIPEKVTINQVLGAMVADWK